MTFFKVSYLSLLVIFVCGILSLGVGFANESSVVLAKEGIKTHFSDDQKYVEGTILVKFKKKPVDFSVSEDSGLKMVEESINLEDSSPLISNPSEKTSEDLKLIYEVSFDKTMSVEETVDAYQALDMVEYAEPNYIFRTTATPDDSYYSTQWGLNHAGDYDIDAPEAWDIETGSNTVVVAVIDTGIDYDHPDLNANMWPTNGYDFVNGDSNPMDDHGHGTHCAGIIAAETNNSAGVAGVAGGWGAAGTQLMALKAFDASGNANSSEVVSAIDYARTNGADVINMSFVSTGSSSSIQTALNNAYSAGLVLVAAAGNDDVAPLPYTGYPASYSNVVAVTATGSSGAKASYANYGTWVDIAAPGSSIRSTLWNNTYGYKSGTSMAAPHVVGVAALLKAQNGGWTNAQIVNRMIYTTKNIESKNTSYRGKLGSGLVSAYDALDDYNLFPHPNAEGMGRSNDLNLKLWKIYDFTCDQGAVKIKINAQADKNGSKDDDDLKVLLDGRGVNGGDWSGANAWNGDTLNSASKTVTLKKSLKQGHHTLSFYVDETPTLNSVLVTGVDSTVAYLEESYPNETSPDLNVALWKDTDYAFTTTSAGTVQIAVTAKCDSNGGGDDDDLKIILVNTDGGDNVVADFGWNTSQSWDGNQSNGCSKAVNIEQFLPVGNYKLQFWADETPHLQSVIISGASNNSNLFSIYPHFTSEKGQIGLVKQYTFVANGNTDFEIIAACDSNGGGDDDDLRFEVDGQSPANGNWSESNAWDGDSLGGNFKTVTVNSWNLTAGSHTLNIYADETPTIASIKIIGTNSALTETVKEYPNVSGNPASGKQTIYDKDFTNTNGQVRISLIGRTTNDGTPGGDEDLRVELDGVSYNWDMNGDYQNGEAREITLEKTLTPGSHNVKVHVDKGGTLYSIVITEDNQNNPILSYITADIALNLDRKLWKTFTFDSTGSTTIEFTGVADKNYSDDDDLKIIVDGTDYNWNSSYSLDGAVDQSRLKTFSLTDDFGSGTHTLQIYSDVLPLFRSLNIR